MKRINIITSHYLPENTACTNRVVSFVNTLKDSHDVHIFTLTEVGVLLPEVSDSFNESNVRVTHIEQKYFAKDSFLIRALYEFYYCAKLAYKARRNECDVTIVTIPYMFLIPFVFTLVKGKKVVDIRDLVWEYLDEGSFIKSTLKKFLSKLLCFFINKYDSIVVTNGNELRDILSLRPSGDVLLIPNGISLDKFYKLKAIEFEYTQAKVVLYVGNVGLAQNLDDLLSLAALSPDVIFNVVGDGSDIDRLKKIQREKSIYNVEFFGKVTWSELLDFYSNASVLYAGLLPSFSTAMPSKIYEYAATGLPILYSGVGVAAEFVEKLEGCCIFEPGDILSGSEQLMRILSKNKCVSVTNQNYILAAFVREKSNLSLLKQVEKL